MPVVFLSKWLVLVFAVFTIPMGVVEYLEYRHAQGAKHAPLVEGEVMRLREVQRWDRPAKVYTLRIVGIQTAWLVGGLLVVVGVMGSVVMALSALPRFSGITLRDDGFEVRELGRRTQVARDQVFAFGIQERVHSDRNVVCQRQTVEGGSYIHTLPGVRRATPDDLLLLMLEWWTHFGPESKDEDDVD